MATHESIASGAWSADAATVWNSGTDPVNGDTVNINSPHVVTFDKDMTGWANGVTLTIDSGATLISKATVGTYYLMTSADITLNGTLQAGTSTAVPLPSTATFTIDFNASGGSIVAGGTGRIYSYCVKPTNKFIRLSGAEASGQTELSVDTDVTADTWAVGDTVRIDDNTTTVDSEKSTIAAAGIAAGAITINDVLAADKVVGAYLILITRNIKITNSTDYAIKNLNQTVAGDAYSWIECEISTSLGTFNCSLTTFNYCTFNGCNFPSRTNYRDTFNHCIFSSNTNVYYSDYSHSVNNCLFSAFSTGFGASYSSVLNTCIFNGGTNGLSAVYNCIVNDCTFTAVLRAENLCTKNTFNTCDFPGCTYAIYISYNGVYYNCDFSGATTEFYQYNTNARSMPHFYTESITHDQVVNAFKSWNTGGIVTSQTASPPTGWTIWYEHACENVDTPCFRQYETTVLPGTAIEVEGYIRIADAADHSAHPPALQIVDKFADPLVDSTQSYLDSDPVATANGTVATWQAVDVIWANTGDAPRQVIVRMYAQHASGDVDEVWSVANYQNQIQTLYNDWANGGRLDLILDDILEDTAITIPALITAAAPQSHNCDSVTDVTGTVVSGTHADAHTDNGTYYQVAPETPADADGFGLSQIFTFTVGVGRVPTSINVNGYFDGAPPAVNRYVDVWVWNYTSLEWVQISDDDSRMDCAETSDVNYQYNLGEGHYQIIDGEVQVRFTSTSIDTDDDLYLDHIVLTSVVQAAAGLTAEVIANAVAHHQITDHVAGTSLGGAIALGLRIFSGHITTANTATSFTVATLPATANLYKGYTVIVESLTDCSLKESKYILSMTNAGVVVLDSALTFTPVVGDLIFVKPKFNNDVIEVISSDVDDVKTETDKLDSMITVESAGNEFTTKALENAPTAEMDSDELHMALDSYTNKAGYKATGFAIAGDITTAHSATNVLISALNNITVADIMAANVEGSVTLLQVMRGTLSTFGGKASGGGTTSVKLRDTLDTKNRINMIVDEDGNRSAVTLDLT